MATREYPRGQTKEDVSTGSHRQTKLAALKGSMRLKTLLEMAAEFADCARRPLTYRLAAIGLRPDGLVVGACNVSVKGQRTPEGHAEYRVHSKLRPRSIVAVARVCHGKWANAKPCASCETILRNARVKRVCYTIGPGEYGIIDF